LIRIQPAGRDAGQGDDRRERQLIGEDPDSEGRCELTDHGCRQVSDTSQEMRDYHTQRDPKSDTAEYRAKCGRQDIQTRPGACRGKKGTAVYQQRGCIIQQALAFENHQRPMW
jgi:hypothetical protein